MVKCFSYQDCMSKVDKVWKNLYFEIPKKWESLPCPVLAVYKIVGFDIFCFITSATFGMSSK